MGIRGEGGGGWVGLGLGLRGGVDVRRDGGGGGIFYRVFRLIIYEDEYGKLHILSSLFCCRILMPAISQPFRCLM